MSAIHFDVLLQKLVDPYLEGLSWQEIALQCDSSAEELKQLIRDNRSKFEELTSLAQMDYLKVCEWKMLKVFHETMDSPDPELRLDAARLIKAFSIAKFRLNAARQKLAEKEALLNARDEGYAQFNSVLCKSLNPKDEQKARANLQTWLKDIDPVPSEPTLVI